MTISPSFNRWGSQRFLALVSCSISGKAGNRTWVAMIPSLELFCQINTAALKTSVSWFKFLKKYHKTAGYFHRKMHWKKEVKCMARRSSLAQYCYHMYLIYATNLWKEMQLNIHSCHIRPAPKIPVGIRYTSASWNLMHPEISTVLESYGKGFLDTSTCPPQSQVPKVTPLLWYQASLTFPHPPPSTFALYPLRQLKLRVVHCYRLLPIPPSFQINLFEK